MRISFARATRCLAPSTLSLSLSPLITAPLHSDGWRIETPAWFRSIGGISGGPSISFRSTHLSFLSLLLQTQPLSPSLANMSEPDYEKEPHPAIQRLIDLEKASFLPTVEAMQRKELRSAMGLAGKKRTTSLPWNKSKCTFCFANYRISKKSKWRASHLREMHQRDCERHG